MGLWCAGHFHIHCSEEASLLEYPLMVSNASSELKSDHVRQLFVLLCEYIWGLSGFLFLYLLMGQGEDSSGYLVLAISSRDLTIMYFVNVDICLKNC